MFSYTLLDFENLTLPIGWTNDNIEYPNDWSCRSAYKVYKSILKKHHIIPNSIEPSICNGITLKYNYGTCSLIIDVSNDFDISYTVLDSSNNLTILIMYVYDLDLTDGVERLKRCCYALNIKDS